MDVYHNEPENFIENQEYFHQYSWLILSEHEGTNIKQVPSGLEIHNWIEDKPPRVHWHQYFWLLKTYKVQCKNSRFNQTSRKRFWTYQHKNNKRNNYTTLAIILHATKNTKYNKSSITQTLKLIQKRHNWRAKWLVPAQYVP